MSAPALLLILAISWIALILLIRGVIVPHLERMSDGSATYGLLWYIVRAYCRVIHRVRARGEVEIRNKTKPGGLIILSNHTSALDPLLIQAACRFHIRWMMASDMMIPELDWFWRDQRIIPVSRDGRDSVALREAIRHVKGGGVLGVFPEGRIVTRGEIRPFFPGIGMIVARTKAPVLLVWVSGTPETKTMLTAFLRPSRSRVEFIEQKHFTGDTDAKEITQRIRERLAEASGWPLNNQPMTPEEAEASDVYRTGSSESEESLAKVSSRLSQSGV